MTQEFTIVRVELAMEQSFQSRVIQLNLMKTLEGGAAELGIDIKNEGSNDDGEVRLNIGKWYKVQGMLLKERDHRLTGHNLERLNS